MENISRTLNKAIDILDVFLERGGELGLTELSKLTGHNTATVYRLISTLVKRGLLTQEKKKGKYSLGPKTIAFGFIVRMGLNYLDTLYLHLSKLCREQDVAVNVSMLHADKALVIDEIGIANDFRITALVGKRLPLHATATGKIFLAHMSADERKEFYHRSPLTPVTKNTITDVAQLEKVLEIVKRDDIAFDEEEHIMGTRAVASPVFNSKERIYCVASIIVPSSRIDKQRSQQLATSLKNCTTEISLVLRRSI